METVTIEDVDGDWANVGIRADAVTISTHYKGWREEWMELWLTPTQAQALIAALQQAVREMEGRG